LGVKGRYAMRANTREHFERAVASEKTNVWEVCDAITGARLAIVTEQGKARQWERDGYTVRHLGIWTRAAARRAA
jgi:hypothetical protein